ncbi:hypothetical protein BGZ47_007242 [Haplosporangium gracile]|nr:hypothetical protein BGZ47_007242 [Haplosporangium gracile]
MGHLEKSQVAEADMLKSVKEYTPNFVVRSVTSQLSAVLKRHYKHGAKKVSEKEHGYMTFTEIELAAFLHKRDELHPILKKLIRSTDQQRQLTQAELINDWLPVQTPGVLIQCLIVPREPKDPRWRSPAWPTEEGDRCRSSRQSC